MITSAEAGDTALITSTRKGNLTAVKDVCKRGIDINDANRDNYTGNITNIIYYTLNFK